MSVTQSPNIRGMSAGMSQRPYRLVRRLPCDAGVFDDGGDGSISLSLASLAARRRERAGGSISAGCGNNSAGPCGMSVQVGEGESGYLRFVGGGR